MNKNISFWEQEVFFEDINIAIIGSGIVGLSAAIYWKEKNPSDKVVVIERGILPSGASTKNAGFACFGSISELVDDLEQLGEQLVIDLVNKRSEGLKRLRGRLGDSVIDYQENGGYELFLEDQNDFEKYNAYLPFFNDRLADITGTKETFYEVENPSSFGFGRNPKLICSRVEGQLHPGNMMKALIQKASSMGVILLNGTEIIEIKEESTRVLLALANTTVFYAEKILVATNGFSPRLFPDLALKPARNQVIITQPIPNLSLKGCFHYDKGYYYFRNIGNRILLGGARNKALEEETTDLFGETGLIQDTLTHFLKEVILPDQQVEIAYKWSGILGIGNTKAPIIEKMSERIGVAVRLGGMGVAIGTLVGEQGAALFEN